MKSKSSKPPINLLTLKPQKTQESQTNEKGQEVILIPRLGHHKLGQWLMQYLKNPYYHLSLDEFGTFVWHHLDGRTTIGQIGEKLKIQFGDRVEPVYDRLGLFIKQLERAQVISFPKNS